MTAPTGVELVVKIGGALLASPQDLVKVLELVASIARRRRVVVIPGGGVFADTVRDVERRVGLGGDEAHWMAILAMDQYAHLLVAKLTGATLVHSEEEVDATLMDGGTPILAPYQWLRRDDPLPHSWDVTSDSIAAWAAGKLGAARLILVKAPTARPPLLDAYFTQALPSGVVAVTVSAGTALRSALEAC